MQLLSGLAVLWSLIGAVLLLPCVILCTEIVLAVTGRRRERAPPAARGPLALVVPAHNEAPIIGRTLRSLNSELLPGDRLLVVADNCSDDTAAVAAAEQVLVLVRSDAARRGKGYALDFALRRLALDPPETLVVVDADCQATPGSIERIARLAAATGRPVQARYRLSAPTGSGAMLRLKQFACAVKNEARPLGLARLGLPCQLMGSGMAFPWHLISKANLASGEIVEDLQLGIELAAAGAPPLFCPEALVCSELPTSSEGLQSQRARWEHGHLAAIVRESPALWLQALRNRNWAAAALAADLMVPPLALLLLLIGVHGLGALLLYRLAARVVPLFVSLLAAALLALSVLLSWRSFGRTLIPLRSLPLAVVYALGKTPLYARFVRARQQDWVRSRRDHDTP